MALIVASLRANSFSYEAGVDSSQRPFFYVVLAVSDVSGYRFPVGVYYWTDGNWMATRTVNYLCPRDSSLVTTDDRRQLVWTPPSGGRLRFRRPIFNVISLEQFAIRRGSADSEFVIVRTDGTYQHYEKGSLSRIVTETGNVIMRTETNEGVLFRSPNATSDSFLCFTAATNPRRILARDSSGLLCEFFLDDTGFVNRITGQNINIEVRKDRDGVIETIWNNKKIIIRFKKEWTPWASDDREGTRSSYSWKIFQ